MSISISIGSGAASVAAEAVSGLQYQQIEVTGKGGASTLAVNPDGSANVSIIGVPNVNITSSITAIAQGSITALQGTTPWVVVGSVYGSGSVVSFQGGTQVTSLVNTVPSSVIVGASIFGQLPAGTAPIGSVATLQGTNPWVIVGSVYGSGSVVSFQGGTQITSIVSTVPSSVIVGASIFGQLPAGTAVLGSVATLQGTTPWINTNVGSIITTNIGSVITVLQSSSLIAINAGSVVTVPSGSTISVIQNASIAGTYAEDAAHTTGDRGLFSLSVRNDTLASITSADGDYSPTVVGPMGEVVTANAPITKWVQGTADLRGAGSTGSSVIIISTGGSSIFTYITGVQAVNLGSASVLVTLASGGSILGYTIAPAGGGSNIVYTNALKTPANFGFAASISGVASVLVSAQGFISKT